MGLTFGHPFDASLYPEIKDLPPYGLSSHFEPHTNLLHSWIYDRFPIRVDIYCKGQFLVKGSSHG